MTLIASSEAPPWLPMAIIGGFLIVFPLMWCGILILLSRCGGWSRLAERFRAPGFPPSGRRHSFVYGRIGWVSYNGALKVHISTDGFFLETLLPFRPGHPALFIPWTAITSHQNAKALFGSWVRMEIGAPVIATITLPQRILKGTPVSLT